MSPVIAAGQVVRLLSLVEAVSFGTPQSARPLLSGFDKFDGGSGYTISEVWPCEFTLNGLLPMGAIQPFRQHFALLRFAKFETVQAIGQFVIIEGSLGGGFVDLSQSMAFPGHKSLVDYWQEFAPPRARILLRLSLPTDPPALAEAIQNLRVTCRASDGCKTTSCDG